MQLKALFFSHKKYLEVPSMPVVGLFFVVLLSLTAPWGPECHRKSRPVYYNIEFLKDFKLTELRENVKRTNFLNLYISFHKPTLRVPECHKKSRPAHPCTNTKPSFLGIPIKVPVCCSKSPLEDI